MLCIPFRLADAPGAALIGTTEEFKFSNAHQTRLLEGCRLATAQLLRLQKQRAASAVGAVVDKLSEQSTYLGIAQSFVSTIASAMQSRSVWLSAWNSDRDALFVDASIPSGPRLRIDAASPLGAVAIGSRAVRTFRADDPETAEILSDQPGEIGSLISPDQHLIVAPVRIGRQRRASSYSAGKPRTHPFFRMTPKP